MMKKPIIEKLWLVLMKWHLKLTALIRYCIEPIQTNPNNQYWNYNKPVLKITLILTLTELGFPKTN